MGAIATFFDLSCVIVTLVWILTFVRRSRRAMARAVLAPLKIPLCRARWIIGLSAIALFVVTGIVTPPDQNESQMQALPHPSSSPIAELDNGAAVPQPSSSDSPYPMEVAGRYREMLHAQFEDVTAAKGKVDDACNGGIFHPASNMSPACRSAIDKAAPTFAGAVDWCSETKPPSCMAAVHVKMCGKFDEMSGELSSLGAVENGDDVTIPLAPLAESMFSAAALDLQSNFAEMVCAY
jgi:hypothetical protein